MDHLLNKLYINELSLDLSIQYGNIGFISFQRGAVDVCRLNGCKIVVHKTLGIINRVSNPGCPCAMRGGRPIGSIFLKPPTLMVCNLV